MTTASWFTVKTLQNNSKREKPVGHATHTFLHSASIKTCKKQPSATYDTCLLHLTNSLCCYQPQAGFRPF